MSGNTGVQVVLVKGATGDTIWDIDSAGHGQVDVVSMPALDPTVDGVHLGGYSGGTKVKVTANNSLCVQVDRVGGAGGSGGSVTVVFDANTWKISSTNIGPVFVRSRTGTDVHVTANNSLAVAAQVALPSPVNVRLNERTHVVHTLSGLNTTFDGSPASTVTASFVCTYYDYFLLCGYITRNAVPTDIKFEVRFKAGNTWMKYLPNYWADVRWTDTAVGANGLRFALPGRCIGNKIRAFATVAGGTGTNRFTVQDASIHLKA